MKLDELIEPGGRGIIATASARGVPNTALYAQPHIIDDETVVWGMTEGRSYSNIRENPHAAYLYMNPGHGFSGVRLVLRLKEIKDKGKMLEEIKEHTAKIVSPEAGAAVKHVAYFKILEIRNLI
jgi:hypothetical protein